MLCAKINWQVKIVKLIRSSVYSQLSRNVYTLSSKVSYSWIIRVTRKMKWSNGPASRWREEQDYHARADDSLRIEKNKMNHAQDRKMVNHKNHANEEQ